LPISKRVSTPGGSNAAPAPLREGVTYWGYEEARGCADVLVGCLGVWRQFRHCDTSNDRGVNNDGCANYDSGTNHHCRTDDNCGTNRHHDARHHSRNDSRNDDICGADDNRYFDDHHGSNHNSSPHNRRPDNRAHCGTYDDCGADDVDPADNHNCGFRSFS